MSAGARVSSISVHNTRGLCFTAWLPNHSAPALLSIFADPIHSWRFDRVLFLANHAERGGEVSLVHDNQHFMYLLQNFAFVRYYHRRLLIFQVAIGLMQIATHVSDAVLRAIPQTSFATPS